MGQEQQEGRFELKKKTLFADIKAGKDDVLPESDLCFQDSEYIYQFKFEKPEEEKKVEIEPGTFILTDTAMGVITRKFEFKTRNLLESVSNTSRILKEAATFFNKLEVYETLGRPKKRGVLLYSTPGMGKTSAIEKVCNDLISEDPGTVVLVWPTSEVESDSVNKFLSVNSQYTDKCTRLVLIIEDIGGGERESVGRRGAVESGLLNLLDGVGVTFKLPTFIIATTNHPENLLSSLADRPGRFDLMMKLQPPSHEEKIALMTFISKRELTLDEKACLGRKGTEEFSIAHLEEIAVRALLHDKDYSQVVDELIKHKELFKKDFEEKNNRVGIGFDDPF